MATKKKVMNDVAQATGDSLLITVNGKDFILPRSKVPFEKVRIDPHNPRYVKPNGDNYTVDELKEKLKKQANTRNLARSIKNNGLAEPLMVRKQADGTFLVREGNRRTIAWESLQAKESDKYKDIAVYVIPDEMDEDYFDAWLGIIHVQGKADWDKYARAKHIAKMVKRWGADEVTNMLGLKKDEIQKCANTTVLFEEFAEKTGIDPKTKKYWHFYEFSRLREDIRNDEEAKEAFFDCVKEGKITDPNQLRQFPQIWESEEARNVFKEAEPKEAFKEAIEVLKEESPTEVKKSVYQLFERTRKKVEADYKDALDHISKENSPAQSEYLKLMQSLVDLGVRAKLGDNLDALVKGS